MPVRCFWTFEILKEYSKYRKSTPNPLRDIDWLEKYYPEIIKEVSDDESECEFCGDDETEDHECRESVPANAYKNLNTK